jgi:hypothetical protein
MGKSSLAALLAFGLVVSGCSTGQQNAGQDGGLDAQDDQACRISGASPGTQPYSECRTRLSEQRGGTKLGEQRGGTKMQTQESRQREIDAKMQAGIPPTSSR